MVIRANTNVVLCMPWAKAEGDPSYVMTRVRRVPAVLPRISWLPARSCSTHHVVRPRLRDQAETQRARLSCGCSAWHLGAGRAASAWLTTRLLTRARQSILHGSEEAKKEGEVQVLQHSRLIGRGKYVHGFEGALSFHTSLESILNDTSSPPCQA
jgi:hypothetical protein